jgi:hypothetical protein
MYYVFLPAGTVSPEPSITSSPKPSVLHPRFTADQQNLPSEEDAQTLPNKRRIAHSGKKPRPPSIPKVQSNKINDNSDGENKKVKTSDVVGKNDRQPVSDQMSNILKSESERTKQRDRSRSEDQRNNNISSQNKHSSQDQKQRDRHRSTSKHGSRHSRHSNKNSESGSRQSKSSQQKSNSFHKEEGLKKSRRKDDDLKANLKEVDGIENVLKISNSECKRRDNESDVNKISKLNKDRNTIDNSSISDRKPSSSSRGQHSIIKMSSDLSPETRSNRPDAVNTSKSARNVNKPKVIPCVAPHHMKSKVKKSDQTTNRSSNSTSKNFTQNSTKTDTSRPITRATVVISEKSKSDKLCVKSNKDKRDVDPEACKMKDVEQKRKAGDIYSLLRLTSPPKSDVMVGLRFINRIICFAFI